MSSEVSTKYFWKPRLFNYELQANARKLPSKPLKNSDYHPLKGITVTESVAVKVTNVDSKNRQNAAKTTKSSPAVESVDFIDPLSAMSIVDPLSAMAAEPQVQRKTEKTKQSDEGESTENSEYGPDFQPWSSRKMAILTKYTTDDKLSVTMTSIAKSGRKQVGSRHRQVSSVSDKLKDRLGQLDDFEEGGFMEMQNLSQQGFIDRIHQLNQTLIEAWNTNQKVKALKIAIQCAKLLGDVSVMQFYPSKFVLVSDLLDTFGNLVFNRILSMCDGMDSDNINPEKVSENAREICVNWMLKIASIRELLPRIYVEASILQCNEFLQTGQSKSVISHLTNATRGVGDPLVALYARTYLCRMGVKHVPTFKGHMKSNFYDFLITCKQIHTMNVQNTLASQKLDMATYLDFYIPGLEWILSSLAHKAHEATLTEVLERCKKAGSSLMLLNCSIAAFSADYVSTRALSLSQLISQQQDDNFPKYKVLRTLGSKVIASDPPEEERLPLLNEVWKFLIKIKNPEQYISCVEVWAEFAAKNFSKKEVNTVLADIIKHMTPDRAFERYYVQLHRVVEKILSRMTNFTELFSMDKFLPFLDIFQSEESKVEVCKLVASYFTKVPENVTSDPIVINGLMYVCKVLHDSISALSIDDNRKEASALISAVILMVTFGKDFEQQLSFYVECRAAFNGLDAVLVSLVRVVNRLSAQVTKIVKENHTRKTASFVRACTAYSFITIPSLQDIQLRLALYLESGEVALISQCITQADAMYKAAVSMLMGLLALPSAKGPTSEQHFISYVSNFLSSLLVVPDNPEQGVLYLLRGLLNVISTTDSVIPRHIRCTVYINVLAMTSAYSQNHYLYHVSKVDSNDNLYNGDPKFLAEVNTISSTVLDEVLGYLTVTPNQQEAKLQSNCALQFFEVIVGHADLSNKTIQHLAITVWNLINHHGQGDTKSMVQVLERLKKKGDVCRKLAAALPLQSRA